MKEPVIYENKMVFILKIFSQKFYFNESKFAGMGLLLAFLKSLVELHNAKIQVTSAVYVEAIFEFN